MSKNVQESPVKIMKICPKCAMEHLGPHQRGYGHVGAPGHRGSMGSFRDRCCNCVDCLKGFCHHPEDITIFQILGVVYRIIIAAVTSLVGLTLALLPLAEFLLLLMLYIAECIAWTLQERKLLMCIAKGAATLVFALVLGYVTCFLLHSLMLPTLQLIIMVFRVTKSYV